nr:copia protein [Tanacetum cinerariifolium]
MTWNRSQLMNFVSKFLGTIRFENDQVAKIMGYGDYQQGNVIISRVYYVEGLRYNLFSVGQFCDTDLEIAFQKNTCFIRNLEGVDLLSSSRDTNLYTISLDDMLKTSSICLLSEASKTKSWLWHHRLLHLNFDTLNKLAKDGLARGILKLKVQKDHLYSACALGKSKKFSHQSKAEDTNQEKLYILHMDLCGLMRMESINGKNYILWIFKVKKDECDGVLKNKAQLVAKDTDKRGIDFKESFVPVSGIEAFYIFIANAATKNMTIYQMDVKMAFLNGLLCEVVYVYQSEGFVEPDKPNHVYMLKRHFIVFNKLHVCVIPLTPIWWTKVNWIKIYRGNQLILHITVAKPTGKHLHAVKRICRFLKGTIDMGLWYSKDSCITLTAYADVDHTGCQYTRQSTSGSAQFLRDKLVSWLSKKQNSTAISNIEAKYIAYSKKSRLYYEKDKSYRLSRSKDFKEAACAHHEDHVMHDCVQLDHVVDSHNDYTSDSNIILCDQYIKDNEYVKDNEVPVIHSYLSYVPDDAFMMIYDDMCEPHDQPVSYPSRNTVVKSSLTADLATYKEHVELAAIGYKNPLCLTRAKQIHPALYNGHEIIKDNHTPAIVHNSEDTLKIAEITRKKMNDKMNEPECVTRKVKIAPHDYSKENLLATFTPQK